MDAICSILPGAIRTSGGRGREAGRGIRASVAGGGGGGGGDGDGGRGGDGDGGRGGISGGEEGNRPQFNII